MLLSNCLIINYLYCTFLIFSAKFVTYFEIVKAQWRLKQVASIVYFIDYQ